MLKSVEGIYRQGKIELLEPPADVRDETRVIVTFLGSSHADLPARGIGPEQLSKLRHRLKVFTEDWDSPEMDVYDAYDGTKARL